MVFNRSHFAIFGHGIDKAEVILFPFLREFGASKVASRSAKGGLVRQS